MKVPACPGPVAGDPTSVLLGSARLNDRPYVAMPMTSLLFGAPLATQYSAAHFYDKNKRFYSKSVQLLKPLLFIVTSPVKLEEKVKVLI